jgi:hypothetical protein
MVVLSGVRLEATDVWHYVDMVRDIATRLLNAEQPANRPLTVARTVRKYAPPFPLAAALCSGHPRRLTSPAPLYSLNYNRAISLLSTIPL